MRTLADPSLPGIKWKRIILIHFYKIIGLNSTLQD
jgi:hypothetical protein